MRRQQGFTLVEVMVALGIFALVGTACYQFLHSMAVSRGALEQVSDYRLKLARALVVIEQDMRHLIPRSVRIANTPERAAAFSTESGSLLEFSRGGFSEGGSIYRDGARRVSYQLREEEGVTSLYRIVFSVMDRSEDSAYYEQQLLGGVRNVGLRFMDDKGRWVTSWPSRPADEAEEGADEPAAEAAERLAGLPVAVEMALAMEGDVTVARMISLR